MKKSNLTGDLARDMAHGLTRFDRLDEERCAAKRRPHNHYALGQYLKRGGEVVQAVLTGADLREEITTNFNGQLQAHMLRWFGLAKVEKAELASIETAKRIKMGF
jgi:hypothetical protein